MRFNRTKCKALNLRHGNSQYQYRLEDEQTKSSSAKDLGVLVDERLDLSQQGALAAQKACPGLHQKQSGLRSHEGSDLVPLFCSHEILLECCIQLWGPH
ncbi:hypothetical protein BTVI_157896 [Pitangus sulphuratus]|nr:hypothetical protein BTVI_157896 [Pitangus sulphuratus]